MAKGASKLTKLKSVIKKWNSFGRSNSSISAANSSDNEDNNISSSATSTNINNLFPVYVGKSRRRYMINSDVIHHPLFRELVAQSGDSDDMIIGCEVVLFEHLLWMLDNADPQPESMNELVQFYAC